MKIESSDNVIFRVRGDGPCLIASVEPPFRIAYWEDVKSVVSALNLNMTEKELLEDGAVQEHFLTALADGVQGCEGFRPAQLGFSASRQDLRRRKNFRDRHCTISFLGECSREVAFAATDLMRRRLQANAVMELRFKHWDGLKDWTVCHECLCDIFAFLAQTKTPLGSVILFSRLETVPEDLWEFIYDHPRVRIGWVAADLADCRDVDQFERYRAGNSAFTNFQSISNAGVWPHVVLPVSATNVKVLPELVLGLIEASRGGTVELVPVPFDFEFPISNFRSSLGNPSEPTAVASDRRAIGPAPSTPGLGEYVEALLAIYRSGRTPLNLVSPLSWVAVRIDSEPPLISSPMSAGAAVAVLADGTMYAAESSVGLPQWCLGNVLDDSRSIRWERLDAQPEVFSCSTKPEQCRACDWRFRCGGVDTSVLLQGEQVQEFHRRSSTGECSVEILSSDLDDPDGGAPFTTDSEDDNARLFFDLYCQPRKALFEAFLWDLVEATARNQASRPREKLKLYKEGIAFEVSPLSVGTL